MDFDNRSFFNCLQMKVEKYFNISESVRTKLTGNLGNVWGQNVLKNDLLFRNYSLWHGSRTKNFVSAKIDI